jgi:hypothetical protein
VNSLNLNLIPDWPRIRKLVAKRSGKGEDKIQALAESDNSLDLVDLVMAIEEGLGDSHSQIPAKLT